jgi:hypothetical protein
MLTSYFKRKKIHNADLLECILRVIVFQPLFINRICQGSSIRLRQPVVTTSMCFSDNVWSIPIRGELGWRWEVSLHKFSDFQNHLSLHKNSDSKGFAVNIGHLLVVSLAFCFSQIPCLIKSFQICHSCFSTHISIHFQLTPLHYSRARHNQLNRRNSISAIDK